MIPSLCYNKLTITADSLKELSKFRRLAEGIEPSLLRYEINDLCFANFLPLNKKLIKSQYDLEYQRELPQNHWRHPVRLFSPFMV